MNETLIQTRDSNIYDKYTFPGDKQLALKHAESQIIGRIEKPVKDYIQEDEFCSCCNRKVLKKVKFCEKKLDDRSLGFFGIDFLNFMSFSRVLLISLIFSITLLYAFNYIFFYDYNSASQEQEHKDTRVFQIIYLVIQIIFYIFLFCFILDKNLRINLELFALEHENYEINESEFCLLLKNFETASNIKGNTREENDKIRDNEMASLYEYLNSLCPQNISSKNGITSNSHVSSASINTNSHDNSANLSLKSVKVVINKILPVKNNVLLKRELEKYEEVLCNIEKEKHLQGVADQENEKLAKLLEKREKMKIKLNKIADQREFYNCCVIVFEDQNSKTVFYNNFKESGIFFNPQNMTSPPSFIKVEPLHELHLVNWENTKYTIITKRSTWLFYFLKFTFISLCFILLIVPKMINMMINMWQKSQDPHPYLKDIVWGSLQLFKIILSFSVKRFLKLFKFDNIYYEKLILNYYSSGKTCLMIIVSIFLFNSLVNSKGQDDQINFFVNNNNFYFNLGFGEIWTRIKSNILFREIITLSLLEMFNCRFSIDFLKNTFKRIFIKMNNQLKLNKMNEYKEIQIFKLWGFYRNMIIGCVLLLQQDIFLGSIIFLYIIAIKIVYMKYIFTCTAVRDITYGENGFDYIGLNECNLLLMSPFIQLLTVIFQCMHFPNLAKYGFYFISGLFNYDTIINKFTEKNLFNRSRVTYTDLKRGNYLKNSKYNLENNLLLKFNLQ